MGWNRVIVLLMVLTSGAAACTLDFPDSLGRIVECGDNYRIRLIEPGKGRVKTAEARFFVQTSREQCWKAITDYRHYPEFMPNIRSANPANSPEGIVFYAFVLRVGLWDIRYTVNLRETRQDSLWSLAWTYVEGDIESTTGSWEISECRENPGWILARYRVCVYAGKFVPAWISTMLTTKSIPGLIKAVRERVYGKNTGTSD